MSAEFQPPEGGWGWIVCLASTWTNGTVFGILNCFGVLLIQILTELEGANLTTAALIGSVSIGLTFCLSPLASTLTDIFGCRKTALVGGLLASIGVFASSFATKIGHMYVTYGVIMGTGFSLAYTPSLVILSHYFKKKMGLVNGLVTTGSAIFTIVLPMMMRMIQDRYGLQRTLQFLGVLIFILIPCACVYTPLIGDEITRQSLDSKRMKRRKKIDCGVWRIRDFVIWAISTPISLFGYFVPFVHLVNHTNIILPDANAEVLIALMGATSGLGRLIFGPVSDLPSVNPLRLQQVSFLVIGVISTLLPVCTKFYMLAAGVCVMGVFDGCFVSMMGPVAYNVVGKDRMGQALGYVLGLMSIPMMVGPPIAGIIFSHTGSYEFAFYYAGAPPIIGACILFLVRPSRDVIPGRLDDEDPLDKCRDYDKKMKLDGTIDSSDSSISIGKHAYGNESFASEKIREDSTLLLVTDKVSVV
ncbi:monocarboxylate transporter 10-like [Antedon mediterranea]|uniref:monocarboxylate transporter 10-like n=1 Tax=Antedon mediterranea TaxID=105859 RepID=UPI003AF4EBBA